jgi:pimeloyl-ACP methyl ester carboxylesterase
VTGARLFLFAVLLEIAGLAGACGTGDGGVDAGDAGGDGGADAGEDPDYAYPIVGIAAEWSPCSFIDGADDGLAECASTPLPLFWDDVDGRTIEIYAKRRLAAAQPAAAQMWFLHGGPGASGCEGLPPLMDKMQQLYPGMDVYTIDHRGVGDSDRLTCPAETMYDDAELAQCISYLEEEWGDALGAYTTSYSAIDVAAYVEATRAPGQRVLVWGGSYGTYIAHRYVEIFPEQADGIVLEGICPADATFVWSSEGFDRAGKGLMHACASDPYCSQKYGKSPLQRVVKLFQDLYWGHCEELGDLRYYLPTMAAYLLYYHPYHNAVPAMLYRAMRCAPGDADALWTTAGMLFGDDSTFMDLGDGYSPVLYNHVVYSEMWAHPDFPDEESLMDYFTEVEQDAVFGLGSGAYMNDVWEVWPRYSDPTWDDLWAETDVPMLMLQGVLDPATAYDKALAVRDRFDGPHQTWVEFPTAGHNVSSGTPVSEDPDAVHCGRQLFAAFIQDPAAELDLGCVDDVLPNDFEGDPELADLVFGTEHLWDLDSGKGPATAAPPPAEWVETLAELRARVRRDLPRAARDLGLE